MEELLKPIWTHGTPVIAAKGYRVYAMNDRFVLLWADNQVGDDIAYFGTYHSVNEAVVGLIDECTG